MKIFFGCSTAEFLSYKDYYFAIRDFLVDNGHILTRDWLEPTLDAIESERDSHGTKEIYKAVVQAINEAEVIIIEDTVSNFSTGHQVTLTLQRSKPVLVLWTHRKNHHFSKTFLHGIDSPYLQVSEYNLDNYKQIIAGFLRKYEKATEKHRFNLVIDEVERKYLEWAKFRYNKSQTEIIRENLRQQINTDLDYQAYLAK